MSWRDIEKLPGFKRAVLLKRDKHRARYIRFVHYKIMIAIQKRHEFTFLTKIKNPRNEN